MPIAIRCTPAMAAGVTDTFWRCAILWKRLKRERANRTNQKLGRTKGTMSARHVESLRIQEKWIEEIVWDGVVETFDLQNHPTAKRAYAWERWEPGEEPRYTVVLGIPPINSAKDAIKAAIVAIARDL